MNATKRPMSLAASALARFPDLLSRGARSAVIWMWAVTAIRLANFVIVLPIVLRSLPSDQLGLWYLMLNVVGLVGLAEFGLSSAVSRQATFFLSGVESEENDTERQATANWAGLHGLVKLAEKIYGWLGWAALGGCVLGLLWLALTHAQEMLRAPALIAYALLTFSGVLRMRGLFWNPLLFGLQRVRESQQIQFNGILFSYVVCLGFLLAGTQLFALAAAQVVALLYPFYRSRQVTRREWREIFVATPVEINWRPIWSSTWRWGAILLGNWLATYGLVFASGQTVDLATSASFSLSNLVAFTVAFAAQSWLMAKYPTISAAWAAGDLGQIRVLVIRRIALCLATFVAGALFAWISLPILLRFVHSKTPPLPPAELALLLAAAGINLFTSLCAAVLACSNLFMQMRVILLAGCAAFGLSFLFGMKFGIWGILWAAIASQAATTLWLVPWQCWRALKAKKK